MKSSDVGRRAVVFESEEKPGKTGTVTEVYDEFNFRFKTDPTHKYPDGREYEYCIKLVNVSFKDKKGST